jgi:hypothetical protein
VNFPAANIDGLKLDYLSRSSGGEQVMATGSATFSHATFAIDGNDGKVSLVAGGFVHRWSAINAAGTLVAGFGNITDVASQKIIPLATQGNASVFDPIRPLLYQVNSSTKTIDVYDTTTFQQVSAIPVGEPLLVLDPSERKPSGDVITVAADGSRLFLATPTGVRIFPLSAQPTLLDVPDVTVPGTPVTFRVAMQDAAGRVDPDYAGTIHFTSSDPSAALPADYTFTPADAGSATFSATFNGSGEISLSLTETGDSAEDPRSDSRTFMVDGERPTVEIGGLFRSSALAPDGFIVHLKDNVAADASSFGDGDLIVTMPDGSEVFPQLSDVPFDYDSHDVEARYRFDLPGGSWDPADNGVYQVRLAPNALSDTLGNTTDAAQGGMTFEVALAADGGSIYRANVAAKLGRWRPPTKMISGDAIPIQPSLVITNLDDEPLSQPAVIHVTIVEVLGAGDLATPREEELPEIRQQLDLKRRQTMAIPLDLTVPDSVRAGTYRLVLGVTPEKGDVNPDDNNMESKTFKIAKRKEELIAIATPKTITFRDRSQPQQATFLIRNTGNVELTGDYDLYVTGVSQQSFHTTFDSFDFDLDAPSQRLHLTTKPGQSVKLTFNLYLPDDEELGRFHVYLDGANLDTVYGTDIEDRL